ncbi:hypothetical protein VYU27_003692 [Nannochloropsis oceanica]
MLLLSISSAFQRPTGSSPSRNSIRSPSAAPAGTRSRGWLKAALSLEGDVNNAFGGGGEQDTTSMRLQRARLRLAEAQGIIPAGSSDRYQTPGGLQRTTKVRDLTFKVAEPEVQYDPEEAEARLWRQPVTWLKRNVDLFVPMTAFLGRVIVDIITDEEERHRRKRAQELLEIISGLGPAVIKAGQALSSRPDLLPSEYLEELQKLQDRLPPYPNEQAFQVVESELGVAFDQVFELLEENPIAAASIGQVYKAKLRSTGETVAVKVQRPRCEEIISVDLYVLRWYAGLINRILSVLKRDIDVIAVIDDFGELIYREIDYTAEAANAQRFVELYGGLEDICAPRVYTELSTRKVLTLEWVDGVRLVDQRQLQSYRADPTKLIDRLVQCSLRQMLENGFFHADPHAGNLLCTPEGKLCYLDFGMMSYVESNQRYGIIEAVIHLVNRDFNSLASLYQRMGFIPGDVDTQPIITALEDALPEVLNASVGELNIKNVINKLGDVMYKFPFALPPYYIAIIRCLGVLEGLALQVNPNSRIINDAYPYIASRLLTDSSPELQAALHKLIFKAGRPRWERLEQLLEVAGSTSDYDVTLAMDQLLDYILSEQGTEFRRIFAAELVDAVDQLGADTTSYLLKNWRTLSLGQAPPRLVPALAGLGVGGGMQGDAGLTGDLFASAGVAEEDMTPTMLAARRLARTLAQSRGFDAERLLSLVRRLLQEPKAQDLGLGIAADISERFVSRLIRSIFQLPESV